MAFSRRRIVVLGTMAADPYAGMAWMHMQIAAGLLRLGHDVYYLETSSVWPYDPVRKSCVDDSDYVLPYLARVAERFGLGDADAQTLHGPGFASRLGETQGRNGGARAIARIGPAHHLGEQSRIGHRAGHRPDLIER